MSCYRAVVVLILTGIGSSVLVWGEPRPIVQVVTPDGVQSVVAADEGRWSVPDGTVGSKDNPIVLEQVSAVTLKIGDRINPSWGVGSAAVNGVNPQTTFPVPPPRALGAFCVGCNGPRPSISVLNWKSLPMNRRAPLVARVSLGVDATDGKTVFSDSNSVTVEVWFIRRAIVQIGPLHLTPIALPATVGTSHPRFQNTFVGVTFANLNPNTNQVTVQGRDSDGNERINIPLNDPLAAQGQTAFLAQEVVASETETVTLLAQGHSGPIQTSFMIGDYDSKRLDGIGGALSESKLLYFPLARHHDRDETTLIFLLNSQEQGDPAVSLRLYRPDGTLDHETSLPITALGSLVGTLDEIFGEAVDISEGYLEVESTQPLSGVEFLAREEDFSAMAAQLGMETRYLLVPHLFVDNHEGDTEIRLLNVGTVETLIEIWAYDDDANQLGQAQIPIKPKELFVAGAKDLLNLTPSGPSQNLVITGYLKLKASAGKLGRYWVQKPGNLVGTVSFSGNGGRFRASLPMIQEGKKETLLLHVAQSVPLRMFTGVSILNGESVAAKVTIRAYSKRGKLTEERRLVLEPDHRVVDVLDGTNFFGPGFEQVKGHLKILSDQPVVVFALFGDFDSQFLSTIEGQAPLE